MIPKVNNYSVAQEIREELDSSKLDELDMYYQCKRESYDGSDQHVEYSSFTIQDY